MTIQKPVYQLTMKLDIEIPEDEAQSSDDAKQKSDVSRKALELLYGKAGAPRWLEDYEAEQARIQKILKQIATALIVHDKMASGQGGHHWGHVGDLRHAESQLEEIRNRLMGTGEYAK